MNNFLYCQIVVTFDDSALSSVNHSVEQAQRKLYTVVVMTCLTHLESVLWLPMSHATELFMHSNASFLLSKKLKQMSVLFQLL